MQQCAYRMVVSVRAVISEQVFISELGIVCCSVQAFGVSI
jgi:hypothetical protein